MTLQLPVTMQRLMMLPHIMPLTLHIHQPEWRRGLGDVAQQVQLVVWKLIEQPAQTAELAGALGLQMKVRDK